MAINAIKIEQVRGNRIMAIYRESIYGEREEAVILITVVWEADI